ncbi:MAG: tRNA-2-methylthio-N(6)-dimethylallyladenosine synthase [Phycisphaerae bacterium]|nr:tRNA-2-methylthio-N(6)-dimethylallyladenosine synthase [Phycisphaerae bacterium]
MKTKSLYLETIGCQMNVLDSELVLGQLVKLGYQPAASAQQADVVLFNTCSVREHAEDKVLSRLGQLKQAKQQRPEMIVGVIGCMAERDPQGITRLMPHVDLICGPGQLNHIPAMLQAVEETREPQTLVGREHSRKLDPAQRSLQQYDSLEALDLARQLQPGTNRLQAYIRVQRGCDKFCTFCVVPFTRGPERSRPPAVLVDEARRLIDQGTVEITLLGQTVNSYAHQEDDRRVTFSELLSRIHDIPGLQRLRFVTSHPGDFGDDILQVMRDLPRMCEYLHLPAQSGSNSVLQRMKRQYCIEEYIDLVHRAREYVPDIQLAGDFIVGFSGESDAEYAESVKLVQHVQYKNIFCFKYSERPGTAAARNLPDDVPDELKRRRNVELLRVQEKIAARNNHQFLGRTVEVLVEGYSKAARKAQESEQSRGAEVGWRRSDQLVGRTRGDHIVVFPGGPELIGQLFKVQIIGSTALTLHATMQTGPVTSSLLTPLTLKH